MERNRVELTGTVERLRSVPTKTGNPMSKWFLKVGDHRFQCVSFGNLAAAVMAAGDGKELGLIGSGAINSWRDDDGAWHNDFQVSVWSIEIDGVVTNFEKNGATRRPLKNEESGRQQPLPASTDEFSYRGGPF